MKNPNDNRRTVRYTGNGHWQEIFSNSYNEQPFSQTFTASGASTSDLGSIEDLKKRIHNLKMRGKSFEDARALELHKDSDGVYQL